MKKLKLKQSEFSFSFFFFSFQNVDLSYIKCKVEPCRIKNNQPSTAEIDDKSSTDVIESDYDEDSNRQAKSKSHMDEDVREELLEDLTTLKSVEGSHSLKDYYNKSCSNTPLLSSSSPFVPVTDSNLHRLSADRLARVRDDLKNMDVPKIYKFRKKTAQDRT